MVVQIIVVKLQSRSSPGPYPIQELMLFSLCMGVIFERVKHKLLLLQRNDSNLLWMFTWWQCLLCDTTSLDLVSYRGWFLHNIMRGLTSKHLSEITLLSRSGRDLAGFFWLSDPVSVLYCWRLRVRNSVSVLYCWRLRIRDPVSVLNGSKMFG